MTVPTLTGPVLRSRAAHLRVAGPAFTSPEDVVGHFGCVQSQDFGMATWAIGRRVDGLTVQDIEADFAAGRILRTHIMRPTWHFVLPEDLGWIMRLTAHRVHRLMTTFNKTIDLAQAEMDTAAGIIVEELGSGQPQTRAQLAERLAQSGIEAQGPRLAHLFINAELERLICNGPMIGKQHSYVLAPAAVRDAPILTEDESLARLARTYVRGHGPSQPADLAWWSSLTLTQCRRAIDLAGLRPISVGGEDFWTDDTTLEVEPPVAALISPFDESVSYVRKPFDPIRFPGINPDLARGGGLLFTAGTICGTFSRRIKARSVGIDVTAFGRLTKAEHAAIEADSARLGGFLGLEPELRFVG